MACETTIAMEYMPIVCALNIQENQQWKAIPSGIIKHGKLENPSLCSMESSQL